ncbi:preprotein translocase subunit SecG [Sphingomonas sp. S-NIH.Pt15_0812]|jgi:preprotein translocase subunit SecG|uniref:preprotein translocase subunit SecG n=1 Tax=Sphingomonas sp. S-NIH.Pt15_0812 TaxID=1920129 RepID=UPI000F7D90F2|nr:preprotein translocase subunit SecG [Sphingomonas sp. S-NIH.Pt15_0812]RSU48943.1 preprotein translocase subunit SecG [Sphingomonas sp. S-NIH.Pt15_0812]
MFAFLLVVHAIIAAALVTVILMQRSEGGGLGMGGSPSGLMSARGAADFLSRATAVLGSAFVLFSIVLAVLAATHRGTQTIDTSLARQVPAAPAAGVPTAPAAGQPATQPGVAPTAAPTDATGNASVPLAN